MRNERMKERKKRLRACYLAQALFSFGLIEVESTNFCLKIRHAKFASPFMKREV